MCVWILKGGTEVCAVLKGTLRCVQRLKGDAEVCMVS